MQATPEARIPLKHASDYEIKGAVNYAAEVSRFNPKAPVWSGGYPDFSNRGSIARKMTAED